MRLFCAGSALDPVQGLVSGDASQGVDEEHPGRTELPESGRRLGQQPTYR